MMECVYFLPGVIGIGLGIWALVSDWRNKLRREEKEREEERRLRELGIARPRSRR
jgi:hypothetical protein